MADFIDPRMSSIKPRMRYNTIGGVNGPLVILDNVSLQCSDNIWKSYTKYDISK